MQIILKLQGPCGLLTYQVLLAHIFNEMLKAGTNKKSVYMLSPK